MDEKTLNDEDIKGIDLEGGMEAAVANADPDTEDADQTDTGDQTEKKGDQVDDTDQGDETDAAEADDDAVDEDADQTDS